MDKIVQLLKEHGPKLPCSYLSVGLINFKASHVQAFHFFKGSLVSNSPFYDLASLTKPLTLSYLRFKHPELFKQEEELLLNHRSGLPSWARLSRADWKSELLSFPIQSAETNYSDLGALRLMLGLEPKLQQSMQDSLEADYASRVIFWKKLSKDLFCPPTGFRQGRVIQGEVNDDNAYQLNCFCTHAGLFAQVEGLSAFLLDWNTKYQLLNSMSEIINGTNRFYHGWDTPSENSLAGPGHSLKTFGHLGYTGTSMWIDSAKGVGVCILSNITEQVVQDRQGLNDLRRKIGNLIWTS